MRMVMTRIISFLTILMLSFLVVSCSEGAPVVSTHGEMPARAVEFEYFVFPGLDWGMTEDEAFEGLSQEKDSFILDERIRTLSGDLKSIARTYQKEMRFLGKDIELYLYFSNSAPSTFPRLNSVQWVYTDVITRNDFDDICKKLNAMLLNQKIPIDELQVIEKNSNADFEAQAVIRSKAGFKDLSDEIRRKYADLLKYQGAFFAENGVNSDGEIKLADDPLRQMSNPLSELTIKLMTDEKTGSMVCMASMLGNRNNYLNLFHLKTDMNDQ